MFDKRIDLPGGIYYNETERGERVERQTTCCFTGHRPSKLPWGSHEEDGRCLRLKARLAEELERAYEDGYRAFICGMARGADLYFCEAVLALRERHPDVRLEAALPCEGQASRWPEQERARYHALLDRCDVETMVQHVYGPGCMQRRDRYMVDHAGMVLSVYNGQQGGTMYTLAYAMRQGLETRMIELAEYEI